MTRPGTRSSTPSLPIPTYEMGALLAGLRAVPVPVDKEFRLRLSDGAVSESDAQRALLLWVNSPGNPAGQLDDLAAAADWGRQRGVLVASDECYAEMTWKGGPRPSSGVVGERTGPKVSGRPFRFQSAATWPGCGLVGIPATRT